MQGFVVRMLLAAMGLLVAAAIVPGMEIRDPGTLILAAFLLGVVNAIVRPIAVFLTFPITLVTLGLFLLVINAAMLGLVAYVLPGFSLAGFGSALLGSIVVGLLGWLGSWFIGPRGRTEVLFVSERRRR